MSTLYHAILRKHCPSFWDSMPVGSEEIRLEDLDEDNPEYQMVVNKIHKTFPVPVDKVLRVQNPCLLGCYQLKKEEYISRYGHVEEKDLFHATGYMNVSSIVHHNFDWRLCSRSKFGHGVSFSPDAFYANLHCNKNNPLSRTLIMAKVLVHAECDGFETLILPLLSDTSTGNSSRVYVKYYDNEFYPTYVAYYTSPHIDKKSKLVYTK